MRRFDRDRQRHVGASRVDEDAADCESMHLEQAPTYVIDRAEHGGPLDADSVITAVAAARAAVLSRRTPS